MVRGAFIVLALAADCRKVNPQFEPMQISGESETGDSEDGTSGSTSDDGIADDDGETGEVDGGATTSETDDGSEETGTTPAVSDCRTLHQSDPALPSGVYQVGGRTSYCDMETADGGWTLVARSAADAGAPSFGWGLDSGSLEDTATVYSLNVKAIGLSFTEVLVGTRDVDMMWGEQIYRLGVPPDFLDAYGSSAWETQGVQTVRGECDPPQGPRALRYIGHVDSQSHFVFGAEPDVTEFGLGPEGLRIDADPPNNCNEDGELADAQGMIFVR